MKWLDRIRVDRGYGQAPPMVHYIAGLAEGRGRKRHLGPSDWNDDNLPATAFCGRTLYYPDPWIQPPYWQRNQWVAVSRSDWCATCIKAWLAVEAELQEHRN